MPAQPLEGAGARLALVERSIEAHGRAVHDASYIVAFFGALFLLAAAAAWWKIARDPREKEAAAAHIGSDSRRVKAAAIATAIAFGLSGVAAILAVLSWFLR